MASDTPPYLPVGTEVSAKFKGAFCEARVKKITKVVKCKVTFKPTGDSKVVTDDNVRGPLRLGAVVEAKYPDSTNFQEATITKINDHSVYLVVFDDGDEKTLRRSALCLKGEKHFDESETLDKLPLTHPEHFGSPVVLGRKKRRGSPARDSDEDSDSESESPPPLRVVFVERKNASFPACVLPSRSKSSTTRSIAVRSFKDGKMYHVLESELKEFTAERAPKTDKDGLKQAYEHALTYLKHRTLPADWEESTDSDDEEEAKPDELDIDLSDNESIEEKDRFVAQLFKFMDERGTPMNKAPVVNGRDLDLFRLFKIVHALGGYNRATSHNNWRLVAEKLGFQNCTTNQVTSVRNAYKKYLHAFEDFQRKLGINMDSAVSSGRRSDSTRGLFRVTNNSVNAGTPPTSAERVKKNLRSNEKPKKNKAEEKEKAKEEKEKAKEEKEKPKEKEKEKEKEAVVETPAKSAKEATTPTATAAGPSSAATTSAAAATKTPAKVKKNESATKVTPFKDRLARAEKKEEAKVKEEAKEKEEEAKGVELRKRKLNEDSDEKEDSGTGDEDKSAKKRVRKKSGRLSGNEKEGERPCSVEAKPPEPAEQRTPSRDVESGPESEVEDSDQMLDSGVRCNVRYGRGRLQKVYEAKIVEINYQTKQYKVHYAGWNNRYDEWIKKEQITAILGGHKKGHGKKRKFYASPKQGLPGSHGFHPEEAKTPPSDNAEKSNSSDSAKEESKKEEEAASSIKGTPGRRTRRRASTTEMPSSQDASELSESQEEMSNPMDSQLAEETFLEPVVAKHAASSITAPAPPPPPPQPSSAVAAKPEESSDKESSEDSVKASDDDGKGKQRRGQRRRRSSSAAQSNSDVPSAEVKPAPAAPPATPKSPEPAEPTVVATPPAAAPPAPVTPTPAAPPVEAPKPDEPAEPSSGEKVRRGKKRRQSPEMKEQEAPKPCVVAEEPVLEKQVPKPPEEEAPPVHEVPDVRPEPEPVVVPERVEHVEIAHASDKITAELLKEESTPLSPMTESLKCLEEIPPEEVEEAKMEEITLTSDMIDGQPCEVIVDGDDSKKKEDSSTLNGSPLTHGNTSTGDSSAKRRKRSNGRGGGVKKHPRLKPQPSPAHDVEEVSDEASQTSTPGQTPTHAFVETLPNRPPKYHFNVIDESLQGEDKISLLQERLQEIRKVYQTLKTELAHIDRRRKKLRKKMSHSLPLPAMQKPREAEAEVR